MTTPDSPQTSSPDIWCLVPVFNNAGTLRQVVSACREQLDKVLVIDDGSTDATVADLLKDIDCTVLSHEKNKGKGQAVLTGLDYVDQLGGSHIITIDADGQHDPEDLKQFIPAIEQDTDALIIGCRQFRGNHVPRSSKFGRVFSNLWVKIETGLSLRDTQSGFRSYPVKYLTQLSLHAHRYDFEIEVLARAAWAGIPITEVDVSVCYPEDRVSSFHPVKSNVLISLMHTRLVGRRLLPWPQKKLVSRKKTSDAWKLLKSPRAFLAMLLHENGSPAELAAAAAVGSFLAVLPLIGCHTPAIIYAATRLHLNKIMATAIQVFYSPPFVPFLCIQLGYFICNGHWWTDFTRQSLTSELHHRLFEWFIGSLILAPFYAVVAAAIVFWMAASIQKKKTTSSPRQRGSAWSLRFFKLVLTLSGLRGAYALLYPVCLHYFLFDRDAVERAKPFIERRFPNDGPIRRRLRIYQLFLSQGKQLVDRLAVLTGKVCFKFELTGMDSVQKLIKNTENGVILLTSHVGNWQLAMSTLGNLEKEVHLVMLPEHNEAVKNVLKMREEQTHIKFISSTGYLGGVVEIMNVLREGNIVSIMGDRAEGFESLQVDFLGAKAAFPYGAFQIAASAKCPILFLLSSKTGHKSYHVDLSHTAAPVFQDRKNKRQELTGWVQDYADMLEQYADDHPMQCFLFQDIWGPSKSNSNLFSR